MQHQIMRMPSYIGASIASPTAAGSLLLLQEYYSQLHGAPFMRSATLKRLVIHTADEAGKMANFEIHLAFFRVPGNK